MGHYLIFTKRNPTKVVFHTTSFTKAIEARDHYHRQTGQAWICRVEAENLKDFGVKA